MLKEMGITNPTSAELYQLLKLRISEFNPSLLEELRLRDQTINQPEGAATEIQSQSTTIQTSRSKARSPTKLQTRRIKPSAKSLHTQKEPTKAQTETACILQNPQHNL
ncbi:Uncharacterized protein DAT39_006654, partial [Clarias magur]